MNLASIAVVAGLSWTLPAGWTALDQPPALDCPPPSGLVAAAGETVVMVGAEPDITPRDLARMPERPARLRITREHRSGCFDHGTVLSWREQGRALSAWVLNGAARRREAEALLNSLVVERVWPPPPPAGWDTAYSGTADSIRVPPRWSVRALRRQRGVARPRTLYRLANPSGTVVLRVREHPRGPVSAAFPRGPLTFDGRRRAGLGFRGYRVSFRVFARAGASARDIEWAQIAARSAGFSSVGRE
ncbi:hypothetical protein [Solirubrobacter deserti]|uniref:Uncharacterized protein n=1 Tax=Solirubrobacter deserti TaxID=2282478 RepID=A0ABT4RMG4_9ACTN|nr:hypothetical protein [Solirubrobacter deserti]MDA0139759.1 hypothetical protein [Solirubrobacter deserti]